MDLPLVVADLVLVIPLFPLKLVLPVVQLVDLPLEVLHLSLVGFCMPPVHVVFCPVLVSLVALVDVHSVCICCTFSLFPLIGGPPLPVPLAV